MRISDWSSDVCSSDLAVRRSPVARGPRPCQRVRQENDLFLFPAGQGCPWPHQHRQNPFGGRAPDRPFERDDRLSAAPARARSLRPCRSRSEEHTSELQSLMRISYAVFCLKKKKQQTQKPPERIKP